MKKGWALSDLTSFPNERLSLCCKRVQANSYDWDDDGVKVRKVSVQYPLVTQDKER